MVKSIQELFETNLKKIYFVENFLVDELDKLNKKATSKEAKGLLKEHRKETKGHVKRVEEIFKSLDLKPEELESKTWSVMDSELEKIFKKGPPPEVADFLVLEASTKAERLEISSYESLILLLNKIAILENQETILNNLKENLSEERSALEKLISLAEFKSDKW